jgi:hypothetical protein
VYGPGDYEALLVERSEGEAETCSPARASFTDVGLPVKMAMVMFPRDGRTADRLV